MAESLYFLIFECEFVNNIGSVIVVIKQKKRFYAFRESCNKQLSILSQYPNNKARENLNR